MRDNALERAITEAGGTAALARSINVTPQAISQWDRVPAERALAVEQATGGKVTRHELRPDLYPSGIVIPDRAPAPAVNAKWVYTFGAGKADGAAAMKNLLGGKGANLAEMSSIGVPVPPGFTITTDVCTYYYGHGKQCPGTLKSQVEQGVATIDNPFPLPQAVKPRTTAELNALKSVESSVGHVIDHVNDVIVSDKLANNMGTNKAASARDKGTLVIHCLPLEEMIALMICRTKVSLGKLMVLHLPGPKRAQDILPVVD